MLTGLFTLMGNGWWRFRWRGGTASSRTNLGGLGLLLVALTVPQVLSLRGWLGTIPAADFLVLTLPQLA